MDYQRIKNWQFPDRVQSYGERDLILYALSLGFGDQPEKPEQLQYVFEKDLRAFPTFSATLGYPGLWMREEAAGIDWRRMVHAEQRLQVLKPLSATGSVRARNWISHVVDRGRDAGALVFTQRELADAYTGELIALLTQTSFCRGDGGCGGDDAPMEPLPPVPDREPDRVLIMRTLAQQALLYRLNGDMNPLHVDPEFAAAAGFERPILHGLCTYGIAARALVDLAASGNAQRLRQLDVRFARPVFTGESLAVRIWLGDRDEADLQVQFDAVAIERDVTVLSHGLARFSSSDAKC